MAVVRPSLNFFLLDGWKREEGEDGGKGQGNGVEGEDVKGIS